MMELFDKHAVSFVSVTQQFNTTNSMGRLTLNILLSFVQFEREIISERTRDKMSAARRKGKWVGGQPVPGYGVDPKGGRLIVNENEAAQVRAIYQLYLERGGKPFTKNSLFRLLTNVIYNGKIEYKETIYNGKHSGVVDIDLWQPVQDALRRNGSTGGKEVRNRYGALLKGLLYCAPCGTGMVHTYTAKNGNHPHEEDRSIEPGNVPRISKLMALAIRFDGLVQRGEVRDYVDLARPGYVTRARITQIMNLLNLAPDIQEAILFLPRTIKGRDQLREKEVRPIAAVPHWSRQRKMWAKLTAGRMS